MKSGRDDKCICESSNVKEYTVTAHVQFKRTKGRIENSLLRLLLPLTAIIYPERNVGIIIPVYSGMIFKIPELLI